MIEHPSASPSVIERFGATNPGLELWWDSSPLVFETWRSRMIESAEPEQRDDVAADLARLWDPDDLASTEFRGATTNPPLSLAAMRHDPDRWTAWIRAYQADHSGADVEMVFWALYLEIVRLGAERLMPLFESSGRRFGHLSGQVDPRSAFDSKAMLRQALEIAAQSPNVMVKIPGTRAGLPVLRELTRRGISTNCTSAFVVPQFVAVAEQVQAGLLEARAAGVDLVSWRSVVTDMIARWENVPEFAEQAAAVGIELTPEDRRWAGIAVFKHAQRVFRERAYPSKMLVCSVRVGPIVEGVQHCWHLEHAAGADAVFTLPPSFLTDILQQCPDLTFTSAIWDDIPAEVLEKLRKVPYFNAGHDTDGIGVEEFDAIPALQSTYREFAKATEEMIAFVAERMRYRRQSPMARRHEGVEVCRSSLPRSSSSKRLRAGTRSRRSISSTT
jgi:transaldolase